MQRGCVKRPAVDAKAKSFTREKLRRRLAKVDAAIDWYMAGLDRAGRSGQHDRRTSS
jgi:hypothetical protein